MRRDVLAWATAGTSAKRPSKETLNHPALIALASGRDPFADTAAAFRAAYVALGIDLINVVPFFFMGLVLGQQRRLEAKVGPTP